MASVATHACPTPMKPTSNGAFQGDNPLDFVLPSVILQILLVLIVTPGIVFLLKPLRQPQRALAIAAAGIGTSSALQQNISEGVDGPCCLVFMGVALSITTFPVLACNLAELKLLTIELGRKVMSAAAVNDVTACVLLRSCYFTFRLKQLCHHGLPFILAAILLLHPIFSGMAQRSPAAEPIGEIYICSTLVVVLAAAFVTDAIGIHALFGAFVVGILIPKDGQYDRCLGRKGFKIVSPIVFHFQRIEDQCGYHQGAQSWGLLVLAIATSCFGKISELLASPWPTSYLCVSLLQLDF